MNYTFALVVWLSISGSVGAQETISSIKKIAVTSLIGDVFTVNTYRRQVGTSVDASRQEVVAVSTPIFDHTALLATEQALTASLPLASIAPLATPVAGSDFDPARLWVDGKLSPSNPLIAALRQENFTHLLVITKHRALARLQLAKITVGSGHLQGLGFYVDNFLPTKNIETGDTGRGFVAPYAYFRLVLLDLNSLTARGEKLITASTARSAADNKTGRHPWDAMTAEEKVSVLKWLIEERIATAVPELIR